MSDTIDPDELAKLTMAGDGGAHAIQTFYNNPTVNRLVARASSVLNSSLRLQLYHRADRIVSGDAPVIFLYRAPFLSISRAAVQSYRSIPTGNYRMEDVWLRR